MQLRMSKRAFQMWDTETWDDYWSRRTRQIVTESKSIARFPDFLVEICRPCRPIQDRFPGPPPRAHSPVAQRLVARDDGIFSLEGVGFWSPLGCGVRGQQGRRWDEPVQRECTRHQAATCLLADDWKILPEDRDAWRAHETTFVNKLFRSIYASPLGRFVFCESLTMISQVQRCVQFRQIR